LIRSDRSVYRAVQLFCDLAALTLTWFLAVWIRLLSHPSASGGLAAEGTATGAPPLRFMLILWLGMAVLLKLYSSPIRTSVATSIRRAAEATIGACLIAIVVAFLSPASGIAPSRAFLAVFFPVSFAGLAASRSIAHLAVRARRDWASGNAAILGDAQQATRLMNRMRVFDSGPPIKGIIVTDRGEAAVPGTNVLGRTSELASVINREKISRIILLQDSFRGHEVTSFAEISSSMGVAIGLAIEAVPSTGRLNLTTAYGFPVLELEPAPFTRWQEFVKRALDLSVSGISLVLLSPLMLLVAILIKATSKGPVLYRAQRVGKGGRHFTFLKFRSMYEGTSRMGVARANEKDGHIFKIKNDPRITPVGAFIRKYSIDELPQLVNVWRGEMSVVGPRPLPAEDLGPDGMSGRFTVWSRQRAQVRPGITGLWQVRGRSSGSFDDMIRWDLQYIRTWSLALDLSILVQTPLFVITGRGAY
jgi:exopolysaccharide biosynthesis polyprenyl glycosylphosphotransferase